MSQPSVPGYELVSKSRTGTSQSDPRQSENYSRNPAAEAGKTKIPFAKPKASTPRSAHQTGSTYDTNKLRTPLAEEMGNEIIQSEVQDFFDTYLPDSKPPESVVSTCISKLQVAGGDPKNPTSERLKRISSSRVGSDEGAYFWKDLSTQEMALKVTPNENTLFKPLAKIVDEVSQYAKESWASHDKPNHRLVLRPNSTNLSSIWGAAHKIDGYFHPAEVPQDSDSKYAEIRCTRNVAICLEFKKKSSSEEEIIQNRRQMVSAANHIMNDDPRRMFIFGITIEGDQCTLWYFCRSHTAVSKSFNWLKDYRTFITMLITFAFASPEDLGYDSMVTFKPSSDPSNPKGSWVFQIPVNGETSRFYRTSRSLAESRSLCVTGKAARVWKVQEVISAEDESPLNPDKFYVLKDVWLEAAALTERQIQVAVIKNIDDLKPHITVEMPEFRLLENPDKFRMIELLKTDRYKEHFLTIASDWQGTTTKPVDPHFIPIPTFLCPPQPTDDTPPSDPKGSDLTRGSNPLKDIRASPVQKPVVPRTYTTKRQYRVIFEEICQASHSLEKFSDVLCALQGALDALFILFLAGWVHRDVSAGNVLYFRPPNGSARGILSDLEYAKPFPSDTASSDPKTGTPFFMPHEILTLTSLREKTPSSASPETNDSASTGDEPLQDWQIRLRKLEKKSAIVQGVVDRPIQHHFAHDLESFWWLFVWFIMTRILPAHVDEHYINSLFANLLKPSQIRQNAFVLDDSLLLRLKHHLSPLLLPELMAPCVNGVRAALHQHYRTVDAPVSNSDPSESYKTSISEIYDLCFSLLVFSLKGIPTDIEVIPLEKVVPSYTAQAKIDDVIAEAESATTINTDGSASKKRGFEEVSDAPLKVNNKVPRKMKEWKV